MSSTEIANLINAKKTEKAEKEKDLETAEKDKLLLMALGSAVDTVSSSFDVVSADVGTINSILPKAYKNNGVTIDGGEIGKIVSDFSNGAVNIEAANAAIQKEMQKLDIEIEEIKAKISSLENEIESLEGQYDAALQREEEARNAAAAAANKNSKKN